MMNQPLRLLLLSALGLLLIAVPAGTAAATPPPLGPGDALPLPLAWPAAFTDTVEAPGYVDLWTLDLAEGQQVIANMTLVNDDDVLGVCLWAPGTTDFSDPLDASLRYDVTWFDTTGTYNYSVPSGAAGTYYIEVWWNDLYTLWDGSYRMWVSVQSPSKTAVRITPPAVKAHLHAFRDYQSRGTLRPLHYSGDDGVQVVWQKYYRSRWRLDSTERPDNEDYFNGTSRFTRFQVSYSFLAIGSGTMRWRVRAIHFADSLHPRKASAWRYFTVSH
jgi:hypothetical protein